MIDWVIGLSAALVMVAIFALPIGWVKQLRAKHRLRRRPKYVVIKGGKRWRTRS